MNGFSFQKIRQFLRQRLVVSQITKSTFKSTFIRNVVTVAGGAALSQAITMAFSPLLTRLYSPEIYGIQGIFMSIAGILSAVAAMTYPVAIVLPKHDSEAKGLVKLSFKIGIATSLLMVSSLFFFPEIILLLHAEKISAFIFFIPVYMLFAVASSIINQWAIRKKAFTLSAKVKVWQSFLTGTTKACVGFVYPSAIVLIFANVFGLLLGVVIMFFGLGKIAKSNLSEVKESVPYTPPLNSWEIAKKYKDFPLYRAPHDLISTLSFSIPIIVLAASFGTGSVGYYSIAVAILGIPMTIIGASMMQVFYPRITEAIHHGEDAKRLLIKATSGLALTGLPVFIVVIIGGPTLFGFIFGVKWQMAGVYAQWLTILLFFQYINKPAVATIPALQLQKGLLIWELFSTVTKVMGLFIGCKIFKSDVAAIALFSVLGGGASAFLTIWVIYLSGKNLPKKRLSS